MSGPVSGPGRLSCCALVLLLWPAISAAAQDGLIRCPDWQIYAPPVHRATAGDGQTEARFETAATPADAKPGAPQSGTGVLGRLFSARASAATATTPPATASRSCPTHMIQPGDTLGKIAAARLGNSRRWSEIAAANPGLDPKRLRVGTRITLPCAAGPGPGRIQPAQAGPAATGASPTAVVRTAPAPEAAAPPSPPPLPVWTARADEYLADVLKRWGRTAGWTVIVDSSDAWRLRVPIRVQASFDDAVGEIVRGLAHDGLPPRIRLYPNNVLRLGGPL